MSLVRTRGKFLSAQEVKLVIFRAVNFAPGPMEASFLA